MNSKLHTLIAFSSLFVLIGCSGSSTDIASLDERAPAPEPTVTSGPSGPKVNITPTEDAGGQKPEQDASEAVLDASEQQDASDAAQQQDSSVPPIPRFGLAFNEVAGERVVSPLPSAYKAGGIAKGTWEGWFKHGGFPADSLPSTLNGRLFDLGRNIGCKIVTPDPVASEAGKVQCDAFQQVSLRSSSKPVGWFHVALTYNAGALVLWVDGVKEAEASVSETVLRDEPVGPSGDASTRGHLLFGASYGDLYSGTATVDEFRFSPSVRYAAPFTPPKHLDAVGADIILLLDDGSGTTTDGGSAKVYSASWVSVQR